MILLIYLLVSKYFFNRFLQFGYYWAGSLLTYSSLSQTFWNAIFSDFSFGYYHVYEGFGLSSAPYSLR